MNTKLNLSDNQKAALLAMHAAGRPYPYAHACIAGQARMRACWSLVYTKHLATWILNDQAFQLTDKGTLLARMLLR